jgi:two-component sensor histidine kinase
MALAKKKIDYNLSDQLNSMNRITEGQAESHGFSSTDSENTSVKRFEYGQNVTNSAEISKKKAADTSVMVGFKIPKDAKEQYKEFFEGYGLNLSEAMKNALEYFASDIQKGKVRITLTRHFERVE